MADFSEIPRGIPRKIALEHLETLEDVDSFKQVCSLWRSEAKDVDYTKFCPSSNIQLPWLMLADSPTSSYRRFYSLPKGMNLKIDLPHFDTDIDDHRRYFSSKGWLIGVSRRQALITFFHPFSGTVINPPTMPLLEFYGGGDEWDEHSYYYQFSKFIFSTDGRQQHTLSSSSSSTSTTTCYPCDDMEVAMIFNTDRSIAFWRPGQQHWIRPDCVACQIDDVCFFRGVFYSIDNYAQVIAFGKPPRVIANLLSRGIKHYIVALGSALLVVNRSIQYDDGELYWTASFKLFEVNVDNGNVKPVKAIGNRALFVGHSSTFFIEASLSYKHSCRPNCIYFTDDNTEGYDPNNSSSGGGADMGIYSLEENKVVDRVYEGSSQFSYETPPLWVELPHY